MTAAPAPARSPRPGPTVLTTVLGAVVLACLVLAGAVACTPSEADAPRAAAARPVAGAPSVTASPTPPLRPARPAPSAEPERPAPARRPSAAPTPEPAPTAYPVLLAPGDEGPEVRELQARLAAIDWFAAAPTGYYGEVTAAAVRGFQAKRGLPATGRVDRPTLDRLEAMTAEPTADELAGVTDDVQAPASLDPRCLTGRVICVDKPTRTLRWVVDGQVLRTLEVRFGGASTPTREGVFAVERMSRDHVSSLYGTSMPYAMFFSGGQAVHYSPDFAAVGYAGASHGCVNVRDLAGVAALYDDVRLGDRVVVAG